MPRSQKPIVCICGSNKIDYIDLDMFINPSSVGQIISEEVYAKDWAYAHNIEFLSFKPNYRVFKDTALLERDKDMIKHCDIVIVFWNEKSKDMAELFNFAYSIGRSCIIHKIISTD